MPSRNLYAIAMVGAVSILCWQTSQGAKPKDEMMELYGVFVDAVEQVETNYVRPVSRKELLESALRGMLADLDPHSSYINNDQWKSFRRQIEGRFGGIGIQVGVDPDEGRLKVIAPMVGTPAYAAGILGGDMILTIDGQSTEGMNPDKAVEVLQGRPGTTVKLEVRHELGKVETIAINRAIIDVPTVLGDRRKPDDTWDFMIDDARKLGYVRITNFFPNTAAELKLALNDLNARGMKGLILDLRDDPGGLLSAAVEVSDLFLEEGQIVSTKGRNSPPKTYEAEKEGTYAGFPMVVLVDRFSASASEIVAAALQDHGRAKVVGERSYGKGSVQNVIDLEEGNSFLKLTVATYWRPSGKNIHRFKNAKESDEWGVSPDKGLEVRFNPREYLAYAEDRRRRDQVMSRTRPQAETPPAEARTKDKAKEKEPEKAKDRPESRPEAQPREDDPDKEKEAAGQGNVKPFVDRQLAKGVETIHTEMARVPAAAKP